MKKLLAILVLGLFFCNNANTNTGQPNPFFGIQLGDHIKKYTDLDCSPCANGTFFRNNFYDIKPANPSPYFSDYVARTTPASNLIFGLMASSEYKYFDGKEIDLPYDDPASIFICRKQMTDLMISLEIKFKNEMPNYGVFLMKEKNAVIIKTPKDNFILFSSCEPKNKDREIKIYRAEIQVISEKLSRISDLEMDEINLKKSDTKGF